MITLGIIAAYVSIVASAITWAAAAYAYRINHPHTHWTRLWLPPLVYVALLGGSFTAYLWMVFTP